MVFEHIKTYLEDLDPALISDDRRSKLNGFSSYIQEQLLSKGVVRLNFICTHNSRRSHFSHIWAHTAAVYFGLKGVECYSGGTEATAVYPQVLKTLEQIGFKVIALSAGDNPVYGIRCGGGSLPVTSFSKKFDHPYNPDSEFAAIMTCAEADEGCPFIPGAQFRFPFTFDDPKISDNTAAQDRVYGERCFDIANEIFYVFSKIDLK
ncbi:low molecular weight phosphatase family protein [Robertkochia solimangrovi]|uniref:arsenate-mycothiol transferase ArsC n=1 Tax=Robertkochia solimangrovi TaxID=2213046 RepID=UPI00117F0D7A|nr:protein-tyrosine-phosphatase [Robertkochia solimangrovi]TRZ41170.1 protein-tyrosine-phosphatase [Robertkochia solimangrovi]